MFSEFLPSYDGMLPLCYWSRAFCLAATYLVKFHHIMG